MKRTSECYSKFFSINRSSTRWEEAEACLDFLRNRQIAEELSQLEKQVQAQPAMEELVRLLARKDELRRILSSKQHASKSAAGR